MIKFKVIAILPFADWILRLKELSLQNSRTPTMVRLKNNEGRKEKRINETYRFARAVTYAHKNISEKFARTPIKDTPPCWKQIKEKIYNSMNSLIDNCCPKKH